MRIDSVLANLPGVKTSLFQELLSVLRLVRVDKPLASVVFTFIGVYLGGDRADVLSFAAVRAALAMGLIVAFSFALNDIKDVVADGNSNRNRPIPSGRISKRSAFIVAASLAVAGMAVAASLGLLLAAFGVVLVALSITYSYKLKGTPLIGNALIGLMIASILPFGALAAGQVTVAVTEGFILTALFAFSTEILYTIRDEEADRNVGVRTAAVMFGKERAFRVFELAALSLVCVGVVPWLLGHASNTYIVAAMVCSIIPIVLIIFLTRSGSQRSIQTATLLMRRLSLLTFIPIFLLR